MTVETKIGDVEIDRDAVRWAGRDRTDLPLVILLHGHGSNENTLFAESAPFAATHAIASPRGPLTVGIDEYSWAPPSVPGHPDPDATRATTDALVRWVGELAHPVISLLGFSQGGLMVTELLRALPDRFASATMFAGFVLERDQAGDDRLALRGVPVLSGRDDLDDVVTRAAFDHADAWLREHARVEFRFYEGIGHTLSAEEWRDAAVFMSVH